MTKQSTVVFKYNLFWELLKKLQFTQHINENCVLFWFCILFSFPAFVLFKNYISHDPQWLAAVLDDSYPAPKRR